MADKMKPLFVALDTTVFEAANCFFGGQSDLGILKMHINDGQIAGLLINDVVIGECHKHFREKAKELNKRIKSIQASREWKGLSTSKSLHGYVTEVDEDKIVSEMDEALNQYLTDTKAQIIKSDNVKIMDILSDYFNTVPPFGGTEKKHEFPDAIMIKRLKEIAKAYGGICAVSDDPDWEAALKDYPDIKLFKSLKELFALITRTQKLSSDAISYYCKHRTEFNNDVETYLSLMPYNVDGYIYGRKGIEGGYEYINAEIQNISIQSKLNNIDYVGEETVIATILVQARFEIECEYRDEENSIWDSEDKGYTHEETGLFVEEHAIDFYVAATYKILNGEIEKCIHIEPQLKKKLTFGGKTLVARRSRNSDGFFSYKQTYTCPDCGHIINVELIDFAESFIIGEKGMGAQVEHAVSCTGECPNCGKQYEISGSLYEYPIGAFNYDDTKIEWKK